MKSRSKKALLSASDACRLLDVKPQTLYAYVSRGLLTSEASTEGRGSLYPKAEVEALKARARARSGHGPTAAGALRWGDPVLESGITCLQDGMLYYRGYAMADLVARQIPFENVAELLWSGDLPEGRVLWPDPQWSRHVYNGSLGRRLSGMLAGRAAWDEEDGEELLDQTLARARDVILGCSEHFFGYVKRDGRTLAELAAFALIKRDLPEATQAINVALVVSADHELNASTFAARVAASTGAEFYACMQAAVAAFSGRRHGMSPLDVATMMAGVQREEDVDRLFRDRARYRQDLPGFGHRLYPAGDPRAVLLLDHARILAEKRGGTYAKSQALLDDLITTSASAEGPAPNLDLALTAVSAALGLPPVGASMLFAVGRMAGWTAHITEQRQQDFMLRPRARYTGRAPRAVNQL